MKKHFSSKIPHIIKVITQSCKKSFEKEKLSKIVHSQTQTIDVESTKITEMRRKVAKAEHVASTYKEEKEK